MYVHVLISKTFFLSNSDQNEDDIWTEDESNDENESSSHMASGEMDPIQALFGEIIEAAF